MVDQGGDLQNRAGRGKGGEMLYSFEHSEATDYTIADNMAAVLFADFLLGPRKLSTNIH